MKRVFILLIVLLTSIISINAIGITPSRTIINFEPNFRNIYSVHAHNNLGETVLVSAGVGGDLAEYIEVLDIKEVEVDPGKSAEFKFLVSLPPAITEPGTHKAFITVHEELIDPPEGYFLATGRVSSVIEIKVPFPGKYAKLDLIVPNVDVGEKARFKLNIENLGEKDIQKLYGTVSIQEGDKVIKRETTGTIGLKSKKSAELYTTMNTSGMHGGNYNAIAILDYDGNKATDEEIFRLGDLDVNLTNYTREFEVNKINRWDIWFESRWNKPIEGLYAQAKILQDGKEIDIFVRTPTINLGPWQETRAVAYWDTSGFGLGEYDANIILHYNNKTEDNLVKIKIVKPKSKFQLQIPLIFEQVGIEIVILIVIAIVILLDIIWLMWVYKSKKKKEKKEINIKDAKKKKE